MKRYWFSILLPVFMAVGIGTYYAGAAMRDLPDYRLHTVAGDPKEAENLVFEGQTDLSTDVRYEHVAFGNDGTEYGRNQSIIAQVLEDKNQRNPDLNKLMKDHSGFMRGKSNDSSSYYADKDMLVYAQENIGQTDLATQLSNYAISIDAEDYKSGKNNHFNALMPGPDKYSFLTVDDVQAVGGKIKLLITLSKVLGDGRGGSLMTEIHLLTVDMDKAAITDDQTLTTDVMKAEGKEVHSSILNTDINVASPSDGMIIATYTNLVSKDQNGNSTGKTISTEYAVLDYRTAKLTPVNGDGKIDSSDALHVIDGKLVTLSEHGNAVHVRMDDLSDGKAVGQYDIPLALQGADSKIQGFIYGDRIYIFHPVNAEYEVQIADLNNGKVVYQGKITVDGTPEQQKERMKSLRIYNFYLAR